MVMYEWWRTVRNILIQNHFHVCLNYCDTPLIAGFYWLAEWWERPISQAVVTGIVVIGWFTGKWEGSARIRVTNQSELKSQPFFS